MTQVEKVLAIAAKEIGTGESPPGSNNTKYNTWYYGRAVSGASYAWCCVFCRWDFVQAGLGDLFPKTAYVPTVLDWAKKNNTVVAKTTGRPGDVIIFDWTGKKAGSHIGIIEKVILGGYITIEGNWENAVKRVQRTDMGKVLAVIRPRYSDEKQQPQQKNNTEGLERHAQNLQSTRRGGDAGLCRQQKDNKDRRDFCR
jgi:hypothetical protein